jgi:hypothetical protein
VKAERLELGAFSRQQWDQKLCVSLRSLRLCVSFSNRASVFIRPLQFLEVGAWNFSGAWMLVLGAFSKPQTQPVQHDDDIRFI